MMTATECPSIDQLRDLTLGQLAEDESDQLLDHLRDCDSCLSKLETMGEGEDSLIHSIRSSDSMAALTDEPNCQVAVMAALGAVTGTARSSERSETPSFPIEIGEYEILRPIGRGGMGNVYLARHTKLGRLVALKVLASHRLSDPKMKERFEAEMRAVGRLSHPGIVTAHDARDVEGTAVLVTEFIDGLDLAQLVMRTGPITVADACEIVRQVAVALQYTSEQGFVHRDVKPSNIMLGSSGEVKLLDLGLARLQESVHEPSELTATGQAMGTADYIAPEQVTDSRSVDVRADIYSLGCTLFKLLTGRAPFAGPEHATAFAKMTAHVSSPPTLLSDFVADAPSGLVKLVSSMLAKDPGSRPQSPMQVADKLMPFAIGADLPALICHGLVLSPNEVDATKPSTASKAKPQPWLRQAVPKSVAIGAGMLGVLIGLCGGFLIRIKSPDGTVVTMKAPEGSEISVEPDNTLATVANQPESVTSNESGNAFLKFAIVATKEETELYLVKYGKNPLSQPTHYRWYKVDPEVKLGASYEINGNYYLLIDESKTMAIADQSLRSEIDSAMSHNGQLILRLSESGGERMRALTRTNLQRQLAFIVNDRVQMTPTIQSEVGRDLTITGNFTPKEIKYLMDSLGSGLVEPLQSPVQSGSRLEVVD